MLVLSRKQDEEILIGKGISIRVIRVQGGRVKLGIEAPDSVRITRAEIAFRDNGACRTSSGTSGVPPARPGQDVPEIRPAQCS